MVAEIIVNALLFGVSLFVLIKSADYFTESAYSIGKHLKLSDFVIGVVIVSIGTSLPELSTTVVSSLRGENSIVLGNILGSNVSNILLILGVSSFFAAAKVKRNLKDVDLPISIMIVFLLLFVSIDKVISRFDALLLLGGFITYLLYAKNTKRESAEEFKSKHSFITSVVIGIVSLIIVYISSSLVIDSIINLSSLLGIATTVISASALAIGTSLPELMVSIQAVRKNLFDMVIGNILGSNIFNVAFILSVGALISPISYDILSLYVLLPAVIISSLIILEVLETNTIRRYEGMLMLLLFIAYLFILYNPPIGV